MNFGNEVRVHVGDRPHYPEDTTYQAEVVYGSSLLRAGGLPSCVVRVYPPGSDPDVPGEQVGSRFETFDQARHTGTGCRARRRASVTQMERFLGYSMAEQHSRPVNTNVG